MEDLRMGCPILILNHRNFPIAHAEGQQDTSILKSSDNEPCRSLAWALAASDVHV